MALPLDTVVKQLTDSGIIAPGKLEDFVPPKAHPTSVDALVAELVKHQQLTSFQAAQVKAGKVRALILGEYTILDRIGAGGMGQVFRAVHRRMDRTVAIKMLPPAMTKDAAAAARFEREVRAAAKLSHPNIVTAHDAGQAGSGHFLVMEYVEGKDLSALVKKDGPLPVNKAVNYILQAARGLEFAHSKGVIHRDIKPANLLLGSDGVVKILDMGLARIDQPDGPAQTELTGSGTIMGTVDFMAPEQALNTKYADQRADIYSLGISLYYLLAGKMAYGGETAMEKLMAHQTQPIPSLLDVQTTVPKQLDAIFKKMVAKRMEDRYQSMGEVIEALEELGVGATTTKKGEVASTLALSPEQKKKLAAEAKKKPLAAITGTVASEKTKHLLAKIVGGAFGTIIAPILVFYLIRHLEKQEQPEQPPVATAQAANKQSAEVATNTAQQPVDRTEAEALPKPMVAPFDAAQAKAGQAAWAKYLGTKVETTNSVGMRMTLIPPGEFLMGSTPEQIAAARRNEKLKAGDWEYERLSEETPQHRVVLANPFLLGATEVTLGQFKPFVEATNYKTDAERLGFGNSEKTTLDDFVTADDRKASWRSPGYSVNDDSPATQITWNDAVQFCNWLSVRESLVPCYRQDANVGWVLFRSGSGYRLPTEAEWEYACRAGTTTQFWFGDDVALLEGNEWYTPVTGTVQARAVGLRSANPFGLYDMHGNVREWCTDYFSETWYESSPTLNPLGPPTGSQRAIRGGRWHYKASDLRSAHRYGYLASNRHFLAGFRIVRPLDPTKRETAIATTPKPSASPTKPWETPEFQAWVKATQALPPEKQIEAVSKKLMELNPGFDGKLTGYGENVAPKVQNGVVTELGILADNVTDISPVRALVGLRSLSRSGINAARTGNLSDLSPLQGMKLNVLNCGGTQVSDLSPLQGMPLEVLLCGHSFVSDLSPLRGMSLRFLDCSASQVSDLAPLEGMPLAALHCSNTKVSDLSPLREMPLGTLSFWKTQVTDLSPLQGTKLTEIAFLPQKTTKGIEVVRQMTTLKQIRLSSNPKEQFPPAEFWKKYDAGEFGRPVAPAKLAYLDPAFQQWVKDTQALPAEQQIEAVSKKLMELNPGFDGKVTPTLKGGVVSDLAFISDNVTDISPVQALKELTGLYCSGSSGQKGRICDLTPLAGMKLTRLLCGGNQLSDLSGIEGMPLHELKCTATNISSLAPLQGSPLNLFYCQHTHVSDLSPLKGLQLRTLDASSAPVSDLSPLRECQQLAFLFVTKTKVTTASVAALQKALPNCKIKWDGEKAAVADMAAAGDGWLPLFNGQTLNGWLPQGYNGWSVANGAVVGTSTGQRGWLMTDAEYADYEIQLEYKLGAEGNSGVFLGAQPGAPVSGSDFCEVQLLDDAAAKYANLSPNERNAAVFKKIAPSNAPAAPAGQWHRLLIACFGKHLRIELNGSIVIDKDVPTEQLHGHIGLQLYPPTPVEFRNISLRPLNPQGLPLWVDKPKTPEPAASGTK